VTAEPENLDGLKRRLEGIIKILMAHFKAGEPFPSASKGLARETLVREFLAQVLPPPFRFGSGAIVDGDGKTSGQLYIVVEFPVWPSFPTPGESTRLYLADSAALVIEVKSDLSSKWNEVCRTAKAVLRLRRKWQGHLAVNGTGAMEICPPCISRVPFLAVGYRGQKKLETIRCQLDGTSSQERPDGVLVIENGLYSGCSLNAYAACGVGAAGLMGFCTDVAWLAGNVIWAVPDLQRYVSKLRERE
jgi:hypothetical protein